MKDNGAEACDGVATNRVSSRVTLGILGIRITSQDELNGAGNVSRPSVPYRVCNSLELSGENRCAVTAETM